MVRGGPPALTCSLLPPQFLERGISEVRDRRGQATPTQPKFRSESELERI